MIRTLFAPPELLSAYAFAEDGSDPDIPKGTHLRIFAGLEGSFPLTPFAVFKYVSAEGEPNGLHVSQAGVYRPEGLEISQVDGITKKATLRLDKIGGDGEITLFDPDEWHTVRVELRTNANVRIWRATLFDQDYQGIAERDKPRVIEETDKSQWFFSAPKLHKLRVYGEDPHVEIYKKKVHITDIINEEREPLQPVGILGLPVEGSHHWYVGTHNRNDGLKRAARGAPLRLNPMDQPDGPFDSLGPEDEMARVEAMLKPTQPVGGFDIENMLTNLVDDQTKPPWIQIERKEMQPTDGNNKQIVDFSRLGTLQLAAIDPGMARFLGFADFIDDLPDLDGEGWDTLVIVGLFAISPTDFKRRGLDFSNLLFDPLPKEDILIEKLIQAIKDTSGQDLKEKIYELIAQVKARELVVYPCVTVVAPVPPYLPPDLPKPQIIEHCWQSPKGSTPSSMYRATFAFTHAQPVLMSAMAAHMNGNWTSRHGFVEVSNFQPPRRATPLIFGYEHEASSRLTGASGVLRPAALLADQDIPANLGTIRYRVRTSDFFGRFGSKIDFEIAPPPRPSPPPPVLRYHIERAVIDLTSTADLSPGVLKLTVAVPHAAPEERFTDAEQKQLSSAIVVPRIDDLPAGSLPLKELTIWLDDESQTVSLDAPGFKEVEFVLPGLHPQETKILTLRAVFRNTDNVETEPPKPPETTESRHSDRLLVKVTDSRPPKPYPTGMGLFWTSAPGPSPEVELKLWWSAPAKSLHRVYLTDQQGLGINPCELVEPEECILGESVPKIEPSKGRVAMVGAKKVRDDAIIDPRNFRLLTYQPIEAGSDNRAVLKTTLPRSLTTVQFLRVVPLGPDGAEPPFDKCGIVPVAVPDSRRPPAPRLKGKIDSATGNAQLEVIASGSDRVALERDEPGLFTLGMEGNEPPQFRIRRAVGEVKDPIYARTIPITTPPTQSINPLALQEASPEGAVFTGKVIDDNGGRGLEPFVRYVYWADVRLPPERRLPAGINPIVEPRGINPVDPANAMNHPRPMSLPSAPRVLMRIPPDPPAAPLPEAVTATRAQSQATDNIVVKIEIANPPRVHAKAIGPYRLAIWTQWPGQAIEAATNANGEALDTWPDLLDGSFLVSVNLPDTVDPASPLTLRLAFVDPIGRLSTLTPPIDLH